MQKLTTEQLRGVVNARIAELDAYKYMSQALATVEQADLKVVEAKEKLAAVQHDIQAQQDLLAQMEREFTDKTKAAEERFDVRMAALTARAEELDQAVTEKHNALETVKAHMSAVQDQHAKNLLDWQERIKSARAQYEAIQLEIGQAKQRFDAFAAIAGKGLA